MPAGSHDPPAGCTGRAARRLPRRCRATGYARSSRLPLAEPAPGAALREAGRLGALAGSGAPVPPGRDAARVLAAALAPRALAGLAPTRRRPGLLALAEGSAGHRAWMARLALARRQALGDPRARARRPGLVARLADARGTGRRVRHTASGMPELTLAWARVSRGRPRRGDSSTASGGAGAGLRAARDRRRRRRAGCPPGTGGRRDPEGAPGRAGRRTRPKPDWCVTLAAGAPSPGVADAGKHRSPDRVREEADRADQVRVRHRRGRVVAGQGAGGRLDRLSPRGPRLPRHAPEDGPLHQRRRRDDEPVPARRGLRHRRRRRRRTSTSATTSGSPARG